MDDILDFQLPKRSNSIIKVIGVGGGGSNAVNYMYKQGITGVDFVVCNTDNQALESSPVEYKIHLGTTLTEGMGAGSKPEIGKQSAIENLMDIEKMLEDNARMVFITAGMGGGTGTGAAPVIAKAAREKGLLTVGIVTIPFLFEGNDRINKALDGVEELQHQVDALLVINNEKLKDMFGDLKLSQAFAKADSVLTTAAKGIAEIITLPGYVNVDFKDVQTVMKDSGVAIMGSGFASGEERAQHAIEQALLSPLLNNNDVGGAQQILLHITSGTEEVTMDEVTVITDYLHTRIGKNASIIWGTGYADNLEDKVGVTVIATGFNVSNVHAGLGKQHIDIPTEEEKNTGGKAVFSLDDEPVNTKDDVKGQTILSFDNSKEGAREVEFDIPKKEPEDRISQFYAHPPKPKKEEVFSSNSLENIEDRSFLGMKRQLSEKDFDNEKLLDYLEAVPAYARKKNQQQNQNDVEISNFTISKANGEITIKEHNKYLNDNID